MFDLDLHVCTSVCVPPLKSLHELVEDVFTEEVSSTSRNNSSTDGLPYVYSEKIVWNESHEDGDRTCIQEKI